MRETIHEGRLPDGGILHFSLFRSVHLERESLLFVVSSAMDFLMTWLLLSYQGRPDHVLFVESNPIARYFLYSWGFDGLIGFKIATVAFVVAICQIIALQRRDVARRLLHFASLAAISVVVYSAILMARHS